MKKIIAIVVLLSFLSTPLFAIAPSKQTSLSATDVEGSFIIGQSHVVVINDGVDEVYIKFSTTVAATTADFKLEAGESLGLDSSDIISNIRYICASGETATVRLISIS